MRYQDAAAFRMALEQRLKYRAGDGPTLSRDRKRVAFDRLLTIERTATPADRLGGDLRRRTGQHPGQGPGRPRAERRARVPRRHDVAAGDGVDLQSPRGTLSAALPALPAAGLGAPVRRLAEEVGLSTELVAGHREAAAMLDPVLEGKVTDGEWSPAGRVWIQGGRTAR